MKVATLEKFHLRGGGNQDPGDPAVGKVRGGGTDPGWHCDIYIYIHIYTYIYIHIYMIGRKTQWKNPII